MKSLYALPRDLSIVCNSLFAWGVGEGMFQIFQPIYLEKWGANPIEIGAILGGMGIAMALAQAPAGFLADRVGSRPVMLASWVLGTFAATLMALANSLGLFIAGMLTYGLTSFVVAPMNSYITSVRGNLSVERSLTISMAVSFLGAFIGAIAGGAIGDAFGLKVVYSFSAVIFLISTLVVFSTRNAPVEEHNELHASQPNLLHNPRFIGLLALILLTMFALYLPQPLTANYLQTWRGFSYQTIGLMSAISNLGNAALMLGFGFLSGPTGFIVGQTLVGAFAFLMWRSEHVFFFGLGYFCLGGYRLSRSMVLAYSRSLVKPGEVGFAFGLVETGNAIATILAPVVAGLLYSQDPTSIFTVSLAAIGIVLIINSILLPRHTSSNLPGSEAISIGEIDVS